MTARQEICDAVNAVDGMTATPYVSGEVSPGTVYLRLERIEFPNPFGGICHWNVCLVLPQDLATAEQYLEGVLPSLIEAIEPHLVVRSVVPQRLNLAGVGDLPVAFINGTREAD